MKVVCSLFLIGLLAGFFPNSVLAQQDDPEKTVFFIVEQMPEFPGGTDALKDYISKNVRYPLIAAENGIQGRVYVQFIVDTEGNVTDVKIARGVDPSLDKEALRVVQSLPKWNPGKQRGQNVMVSYTLPVSFSLNGQKPEEEKVTVHFMNNTMQLRGPDELIKKMRPYMQSGKPTTHLGDIGGYFSFDYSGETPDDPIFNIVEDMPKYPGGEAALREFIANNVRYPEEAYEEGIQGRVYINFVVSKEGAVKDAKVVRGVHPALDKEALRVVSEMPEWQPGRQRGMEVDVSYTIPVQFSLQ